MSSVMNQFATIAASTDVVYNPIIEVLDTETVISLLGLVPAVEVEVEVEVVPAGRLDITFDEGECEPMTVTTRSGEYTMVHVQDVSVQFSGRSFARLSNVSGWLFVSKCNRYSDMLLNADAFGTTPEWVAREWIKSNNQIETFNTTVTIK